MARCGTSKKTTPYPTYQPMYQCTNNSTNTTTTTTTTTNSNTNSAPPPRYQTHNQIRTPSPLFPTRTTHQPPVPSFAAVRRRHSCNPTQPRPRLVGPRSDRKCDVYDSAEFSRDGGGKAAE
jgi:hypothetical protein